LRARSRCSSRCQRSDKAVPTIVGSHRGQLRSSRDRWDKDLVVVVRGQRLRRRNRPFLRLLRAVHLPRQCRPQVRRQPDPLHPHRRVEGEADFPRQ